MDPHSLRNFRDFLQVYNLMSETCFARCVQTLNDRTLSDQEANCVNMCARKHINVNHKIMQVYMEVQPIIVEQRMQEMNKRAEQAEAAMKAGEINKGAQDVEVAAITDPVSTQTKDAEV